MARQLRMVRPNLEALPALELPAGYGMRTYRKGDEAHWARIISDSFGGRERTAQDTKTRLRAEMFLFRRVSTSQHIVGSLSALLVLGGNL